MYLDSIDAQTTRSKHDISFLAKATYAKNASITTEQQQLLTRLHHAWMHATISCPTSGCSHPKFRAHCPYRRNTNAGNFSFPHLAPSPAHHSAAYETLTPLLRPALLLHHLCTLCPSFLNTTPVRHICLVLLLHLASHLHHSHTSWPSPTTPACI
jgi:hypothetical protein